MLEGVESSSRFGGQPFVKKNAQARPGKPVQEGHFSTQIAGMKPAYIEELKAEPGHVSLPVGQNMPKVKGWKIVGNIGNAQFHIFHDLFQGLVLEICWPMLTSFMSPMDPAWGRRNDCICQAQKPKKMVVDTGSGGKPSLDEFFGRTSEGIWVRSKRVLLCTMALHHFINRYKSIKHVLKKWRRTIAHNKESPVIVLGWAHVSGWDLECSSSFELGHERMFDGCSMSERPWSSDHSQSPDLDETCTGMAVQPFTQVIRPLEALMFRSLEILQCSENRFRIFLRFRWRRFSSTTQKTGTATPLRRTGIKQSPRPLQGAQYGPGMVHSG